MNKKTYQRQSATSDRVEAVLEYFWPLAPIYRKIKMANTKDTKTMIKHLDDRFQQELKVARKAHSEERIADLEGCRETLRLLIDEYRLVAPLEKDEEQDDSTPASEFIELDRQKRQDKRQKFDTYESRGGFRPKETRPRSRSYSSGGGGVLWPTTSTYDTKRYGAVGSGSSSITNWDSSWKNKNRLVAEADDSDIIAQQIADAKRNHTEGNGDGTKTALSVDAEGTANTCADTVAVCDNANDPQTASQTVDPVQ